jgi:riboflavin-specific deaminase-like protein
MDVAPSLEIDGESAWRILLAARDAARTGAGPMILIGLAGPAWVALAPDDPRPVAAFESSGWSAPSTVSEAAATLFDLYAAFVLAGPARAMTIGHLGQSLDGRIATANGQSHYVTGEENRRHLHRMRALCDAIVVGARTVEHDDPRLTTRNVEGPSPLRVILDPEARLATRYAVFSDGAADTILVRGEDAVSGAGHGKAEIAVVARGGDAGFDPADVLRLLHDRGHHAVFVEGGGVTVSSFLAAGALDRLQITVAPLIIGSGTPGITLPVIDDLAEGLRPPARVFPMGDDILFDCDMRAT